MKIRVENLSVSSTKAELLRAFERCGSVVSVDIVTSRATGIHLGFALVEMALAADAYDAIRTLDGTDLGGRNIKVREVSGSRLTRPLHGH